LKAGVTRLSPARAQKLWPRKATRRHSFVVA
jgi:hypothetical protein